MPQLHANLPVPGSGPAPANTIPRHAAQQSQAESGAFWDNAPVAPPKASLASQQLPRAGSGSHASPAQSSEAERSTWDKPVRQKVLKDDWTHDSEEDTPAHHASPGDDDGMSPGSSEDEPELVHVGHDDRPSQHASAQAGRRAESRSAPGPKPNVPGTSMPAGAAPDNEEMQRYLRQIRELHEAAQKGAARPDAAQSAASANPGRSGAAPQAQGAGMPSAQAHEGAAKRRRIMPSSGHATEQPAQNPTASSSRHQGSTREAAADSGSNHLPERRQHPASATMTEQGSQRTAEGRQQGVQQQHQSSGDGLEPQLRQRKTSGPEPAEGCGRADDKPGAAQHEVCGWNILATNSVVWMFQSNKPLDIEAMHCNKPSASWQVLEAYLSQ